MKRLVMLLTISLFWLATSPSNPIVAAMAQGRCGGIDGRVTTPEGWLIPMAKIILVKRETKQTTNVQTEENGQYATCLSPGTYNVTVIAPGFKTAKRKAVTVENAIKSIIDFPMKRGGPRTSY